MWSHCWHLITSATHLQISCLWCTYFVQLLAGPTITPQPSTAASVSVQIHVHVASWGCPTPWKRHSIKFEPSKVSVSHSCDGDHFSVLVPLGHHTGCGWPNLDEIELFHFKVQLFDLRSVWLKEMARVTCSWPKPSETEKWATNGPFFQGSSEVQLDPWFANHQVHGLQL